MFFPVPSITWNTSIYFIRPTGKEWDKLFSLSIQLILWGYVLLLIFTAFLYIFDSSLEMTDGKIFQISAILSLIAAMKRKATAHWYTAGLSLSMLFIFFISHKFYPLSATIYVANYKLLKVKPLLGYMALVNECKLHGVKNNKTLNSQVDISYIFRNADNSIFRTLKNGQHETKPQYKMNFTYFDLDQQEERDGDILITEDHFCKQGKLSLDGDYSSSISIDNSNPEIENDNKNNIDDVYNKLERQHQLYQLLVQDNYIFEFQLFSSHHSSNINLVKIYSNALEENLKHHHDVVLSKSESNNNSNKTPTLTLEDAMPYCIRDLFIGNDLRSEYFDWLVMKQLIPSKSELIKYETIRKVLILLLAPAAILCIYIGKETRKVVLHVLRELTAGRAALLQETLPLKYNEIKSDKSKKRFQGTSFTLQRYHSDETIG